MTANARAGFDVETKAHSVGGVLVAELPSSWSTPWGTINGGFAAGVAVRSVIDASTPAVPASVAVQFLRPVASGTAELHHEELRTGGRTRAVRVRLVQEHGDALHATVWLVGEEGVGLEHHVADPPKHHGPAGLRTVRDLMAEEGLPLIEFWDNIEVRPREWVPFSRQEVRPPVEGGWLRLDPAVTLDDPGVATAALLTMVDVMVAIPIWHPHAGTPATSTFFPMTLDLTAQLFDVVQSDPWVCIEASAPVATRGLVGGRASAWSTTGRLMAYATCQMVCRRQPPGL